MADYQFFKTNDSNVLVAGTAPSFTLFVKAADGTAPTNPAPTISTIATGVYTFTYTPAETVVYEIDLGDDISSAPYRYIRGVLDASDRIAEIVAHVETMSEIKRKSVAYLRNASMVPGGRNVGLDKPSHIKVDTYKDVSDISAINWNTPDLTYYVVLQYVTINDPVASNQIIAVAAPTDEPVGGSFVYQAFV